MHKLLSQACVNLWGWEKGEKNIIKLRWDVNDESQYEGH